MRERCFNCMRFAYTCLREGQETVSGWICKFCCGLIDGVYRMSGPLELYENLRKENERLKAELATKNLQLKTLNQKIADYISRVMNEEPA